MPRPMVGHNMQRMQPQGMMAYNFPARAGMNPSATLKRTQKFCGPMANVYVVVAKSPSVPLPQKRGMAQPHQQKEERSWNGESQPKLMVLRFKGLCYFESSKWLTLKCEVNNIGIDQISSTSKRLCSSSSSSEPSSSSRSPTKQSKVKIDAAIESRECDQSPNEVSFFIDKSKTFSIGIDLSFVTVMVLLSGEMVRMRTDVSGGRTIRNLYNGIVEFQSVKTTCLVCAQTILIQLRTFSLSDDCCKMNPSLVVCFFPENLISQMKTQLFIVNAAYDTWQHYNCLGIGPLMVMLTLQVFIAPTSAHPSGFWHDFMVLVL
ncbi:LOW QUALITY PROTEIN: hypothetical protein HID58_007705 [Brassica napus]|uniref:Pectin acetylesterase n=1 Tax=Brassica napus TaxID=3708 RepID=A0ABQ8EEX2_BRANA|nr:LOW QUALITY PROTEIN: hypothetical protein HID58_007705 [Brassica napus]